MKKLYITFILLVAVAGVRGQEEADSLSVEPGVNEVAFGRQRSLETTSSVYRVGGEQLSTRPALSTSEALTGRIPGLTTVQTTSAPGSSVSLFLRGRNTYRTETSNSSPGNSPLILIDGFKGDVNNLALSEIESVTVLKDAAALVLYGMDGANGAVLVTTKRGGFGPTSVTVDVQQGVMQPTVIPDLLGAQSYATLYNEALVNDNREVMYRNISRYETTVGPESYLYPDNDYWRRLTRKIEPFTVASVQLTGGGNAVRYYVNGSYLHNGGLFKHTDRSDKYSSQLFEDRFNLRANVDASITRAFTARVDVSAMLGKINEPGAGSSIHDILYHFTATPPLAFPLVNPDGSYGGTTVWSTNPRALIESTGYKKTLNRNINATIRLHYDFSGRVEGLSASAGANVYADSKIIDAKTKSYATKPLSGYDTAGGQYSYGSVQGIDGDLVWNNAPTTTFQRYTFDANIAYERSFGPHKINSLLLWRAEQDHLYNDYYKPRRIYSGLRAHYGYGERYFAEFTAGYSGQEMFVPGKRFGFFPAGALAWVISNEDFLKNSKSVDFLKVRASYGVAGGTSLPLSGSAGSLYGERIFYRPAFVAGQPVFFGDQSNYTRSWQERFVINPGINWERSHKTDVSVEATLLGRLDLLLDLFHDRRTDIFTIDRYMPGIAGMNLGGRQKRGNGGEVVNRGFEAVVGIRGGRQLRYNITGALWYARNKIVKRPDATIYTSGAASEIGKPVNQMMGLLANGFFPVGTPYGASSDPFQSFGFVGPGDLRYIDTTGDGMIDINDRVAMGHPDLPEYTYSIQVELDYKRFYLNIMGQGTMNSSMMMTSYPFMVPLADSNNAYKYAGRRWTPETASTARYPRLSTQMNENNTVASSLWLRSTSYFKLRDVELGYHLPEGWLNRIGIKGMRVFARGNNLLTLTKDIDFIDPEALFSGYPLMRMYSVGINLKF